ncbi:MAG: hypothetical protein ACK4K1_02520 [Flavobacterium sp.]
MIRSTEEVVKIVIPAGINNREKVSFQPPVGKVVGLLIYTNDKQPRNGNIRAELREYTGKEISKLQDIRNYRSRESGYFDGCKPVDFDANGTSLDFEIIADDVFDNDFTAELILIYADTRQLY